MMWKQSPKLFKRKLLNSASTTSKSQRLSPSQKLPGMQRGKKVGAITRRKTNPWK